MVERFVKLCGLAMLVFAFTVVSPAHGAIDEAESSSLSLSSAIHDPLEDPEYEEPVFDFSPPPHSGYFVRVSGLVLDPVGSGMAIPSGDPVDLNIGGGVSAAIGYRFPGAPLTFEFEYAYRYLDADGTGGMNDGSVSLNTLSWNAMFDYPDLIGPVGVYAGGGIGFNISSFSFRSSGGAGSAAIDGTGFFWQAMAGVTVSVHPQAQILAGIRWSDAGDMGDDTLEIDGEMLNYEIGFRIFF